MEFVKFKDIVGTCVIDSMPEVDYAAEYFKTTPREMLKAAFRESDLAMPEDQADAFIDLILDFYNDNTIPTYDRMPNKLKKHIDQLFSMTKRNMGVNNAIGMYSKEGISKMVLEQFTSDQAFKGVMNQFDQEIAEASSEFVQEMNEYNTKTYKEIFEAIDEIAKENPEQAQKIIMVKRSFEYAKIEQDQPIASMIAFLASKPTKYAKRLTRNYASNAYQYDKQLSNENTGYDIQFPSMDDIFKAVRIITKDKFSSDEYKAFCSLLSDTILYNATDGKPNDVTNLGVVSFAHKITSNIYRCKFTMGTKDTEIAETAIGLTIKAISNRIYGKE